MTAVCVVGAGIVGLSSAVRLQQQVPGLSVTLLAERFSRDTTSHGAAGIWEPYMLGAKQDQDLIQRWGEESFQHMVSLAQSEEGFEAGAFLISGYSLFNNQPVMPPWKNTVFGMREMTQEELKLFPGRQHGLFHTTAVTECRKYLPWLMKRFLQNGGKVFKQKLHSLSQLPPKYDIVVVCCGLGSGQLLGDQELIPIRGQVMRVTAPAIKHFVMDDDNDIYIIPCGDSVVLGGTHDAGESGTQVSEYHKKRILEGAARLLPALKGCEVQADWVGIRPTRSRVHLEKQKVDCGCNRQLKVVYNYGHGGSGIGLHWGCAGDVVKLVQEYIMESHNQSKL